jgi:hypothetical protein
MLGGKDIIIVPNYLKGDVVICYVRQLYRARDRLVLLNCVIHNRKTSLPKIVQTNESAKLRPCSD